MIQENKNNLQDQKSYHDLNDGKKGSPRSTNVEKVAAIFKQIAGRRGNKLKGMKALTGEVKVLTTEHSF